MPRLIAMYPSTIKMMGNKRRADGSGHSGPEE